MTKMFLSSLLQSTVLFKDIKTTFDKGESERDER